MRIAFGCGLTILLLSTLLIGPEQKPPAAAASQRGPREEALAPRVVSMSPSLTAILVALGATQALVGVDNFSARQEPAVASLPRVGGLYNPSLEAVASLRPDLVVLVPSFEQRDFRARLGELGIEVVALDPISFDDVLDSILRLGKWVKREGAARARVAEIRKARAAVERAARSRPRARAVLVLQRDPLFVAGRGSFLDDMLGAAGAENLAAVFDDPYPRASMEWLVAAAPTVILDSAPGSEQAAAFWARWPSLPAVAAGRVITLPPRLVTLPGPYLDRALLALARALHGPQALAYGEDAP